jgi:hypothetical protein
MSPLVLDNRSGPITGLTSPSGVILSVPKLQNGRNMTGCTASRRVNLSRLLTFNGLKKKLRCRPVRLTRPY